MQQRRGSHSVFSLQVHLVFSTKYRYKVLRGEVQERCRDLMRQTCDARDVRILKGVVSADHVHLHLSYPPKHAVSDIVRRIKGRSARKLLQEYPTLKRRYWGGHFRPVRGRDGGSATERGAQARSPTRSCRSIWRTTATRAGRTVRRTLFSNDTLRACGFESASAEGATSSPSQPMDFQSIVFQSPAPFRRCSLPFSSASQTPASTKGGTPAEPDHHASNLIHTALCC